MPVKLTTAPTSVRPLLSCAISWATSKSASCIRMVAATLMANSAAGHRRKERDLTGARDRRVCLDVGMIDRGADHLRLLERVRIGLAAVGQPRHQRIDGAHAGGRLDGFLRLADPLAHPGEIFHFHPSSSLMR